jgi:hypothetical protein
MKLEEDVKVRGVEGEKESAQPVQFSARAAAYSAARGTNDVRGKHGTPHDKGFGDSLTNTS